jgi:putative nucleotidyltransferase with HDIG domain
MRKVHIDNIKPGDINGKAIYSLLSRQRLLNRGVPILPQYIKRLKAMGVSYIYIEDDISEGIEPQTMIPEELDYEVKQCISSVMHKIKNGKDISDMRDVSGVVGKVMDSIFLSSDLKINITDIRAVDDYTFSHSVSVCTLALILGSALGFNELELRDLGIGAILHDIGKIKIPNSVLNKKGKLTDEEMEIIKTHTTKGFNILRKYDTLSRNSVYVALGHHERYDGSGYPNGFTNEQTHIYSRIVSIVDTFDAMNSDRVYRKGIETKKVINYLRLMSNKHYDGKLVEKFIEKVNVYPNGTMLTLNTGEKAIVIESNFNDQERPKVRIYADENGRLYKSFKEVDLSTDISYSITQTDMIMQDDVE